MGYLFLVFALILNASANMLMKLGAGAITSKGEGGALSNLIKASTNPHLIIGVILFALNVVFYVVALSRLNLSVAYPLMTSGGFLLITIFSYFYLKETISIMQLLGLLIIIVGIVLVTTFTE